jgi:hypothetical protein
MPTSSHNIELSTGDVTVEVPEKYADTPQEAILQAVKETRRVSNMLLRCGKGNLANPQGTFEAQIRRQLEEIELKEGYRFYRELMEKFKVEDAINEEDFHTRQEQKGPTIYKRDAMIKRAKRILENNWKVGTRVSRIGNVKEDACITGVSKLAKIGIIRGKKHSYVDPFMFETADPQTLN